MTSFPESRRAPYKVFPAIRLQNPATNGYLHLEGKGETPSTDYAWCGSEAQADSLEEKAQTWPYIRVRIPRSRKEIPD